MRAFRNTQQIRKDLLQNCISKTQTTTDNNTTINNTMEFANNNLNPDIYDERMYNSLFNNNHQYQHFHKSLKNNSNNSFYSQAQIDRMKNYINKYPIQNDYLLFKKV